MNEITRYGFEDAEGVELIYSTFDAREAREHAQRYNLRLIAYHTIQCWPRGTSYAYQGDPQGPATQRKLRVQQYNGAKQLPWRKGTPEEWREILINIRAGYYQERDVLAR